MTLNAVLIILLGLLCLIGTVLCVIFAILGFANNRSGKYAWLTGFLVCLIGMVFCIYLFVTKAVNKVKHFTENLNERMTESWQSYSDSLSYSNQAELQSNEHIQLLKSYYPDSSAVSDQFYYYTGFESYYRFPLRYPYSIHCNLFKENGDLYDESKVARFDENDNGEIKTSIDQIDRIALDKNYLLIDRKVSSTRSADPIHHYILFHFDSGQSEEATSEKELMRLAKQKGYQGAEKLITINEYNDLFYPETKVSAGE
jgi:ABC-type multidrug transport system fused ATPase/permease subunit